MIHFDSELITVEINCINQEPGIARNSVATYLQQGPKIIMTNKINVHRVQICEICKK